MSRIKDNKEEEQSATLLKIAVQDKIECYDLELLTNIVLTIPLNTQDLCHHVRNVTVVVGHCLGQDYLLYSKLLTVQEHIEAHKMSCRFEFGQNPLFGGVFFWNKINFKMYRFLESYAHAVTSKLQKVKLKFEVISE